MTRFLEPTRERFLLAIAASLPAERFLELYFFSPIRQGGVESGVAVIAAHLEEQVPCHSERSEESALPDPEQGQIPRRFAPRSVRSLRMTTTVRVATRSTLRSTSLPSKAPTAANGSTRSSPRRTRHSSPSRWSCAASNAAPATPTSRSACPATKPGTTSSPPRAEHRRQLVCVAYFVISAPCRSRASSRVALSRPNDRGAMRNGRSWLPPAEPWAPTWSSKQTISYPS